MEEAVGEMADMVDMDEEQRRKESRTMKNGKDVKKIEEKRGSIRKMENVTGEAEKKIMRRKKTRERNTKAA